MEYQKQAIKLPVINFDIITLKSGDGFKEKRHVSNLDEDFQISFKRISKLDMKPAVVLCVQVDELISDNPAKIKKTVPTCIKIASKKPTKLSDEPVVKPLYLKTKKQLGSKLKSKATDVEKAGINNNKFDVSTSDIFNKMEQVDDFEKVDDNIKLDVGDFDDLVSGLNQVRDFNDDVGELNPVEDVKKADDNNDKLDIDTSDIINDTKQVHDDIKNDKLVIGTVGDIKQVEDLKKADYHIEVDVDNLDDDVGGLNQVKDVKKADDNGELDIVNDVKKANINNNKLDIDTSAIINRIKQVPDVKQVDNDNNKLDIDDDVGGLKQVKDVKKADDNGELDIGNVADIEQVEDLKKADYHIELDVDNSDDDVGGLNQFKDVEKADDNNDDLNQAENNNDNFDIGTADAVEMKEVEDNIKDDDNNNKLDENRAEHPKKYNKRVSIYLNVQPVHLQKKKCN
ncbi:coiled-coil domain-containing protein 1-like [Aphidius gifuensis]|uniref:coiled-coil domain-containing protein 1-like n=1 Tax=Aphidius gifuensis TaxID=684658 RepID=UPI001CDC3F02|nr:coiled-coil domain-containing protein 1-like [Aphidius gifuensis]